MCIIMYLISVMNLLTLYYVLVTLDDLCLIVTIELYFDHYYLQFYVSFLLIIQHAMT